MTALRISFDLPEHGWLGISFAHGDHAYEDSFSHIYPSLTDLCHAACDVACGYPARRVAFLLEPAELELSLPSVSAPSLTVTRFHGRLRAPSDPGRRVFDSVIAPHDAVLACWRALRRLQTSLTTEDFTSRWREPFPEAPMRSLAQAVATLEK